MSELVRARTPEGLEITVARSRAELKGLEIVEGSPVYEKGQIRGATRADGRPIKPKARIASAIPTPPTVAGPGDGNSDDGQASVSGTEESK